MTDDPPHELALAWECQRWGMPLAGGYFDQPLGMMRRMNAALNVYNAYTSVERLTKANKNLVDWSVQYPELFKLIASIEKMRQEDDD